MKAKTTVTKGNIVERQWHLVDAEGQILGRTCTKIAALLMGKNKVDFSPNRDAGDYVVVINASKIQVTGNKAKEKIYYHYSGYPGGLKELSFNTLLSRDPAKVILHGVAGMIPKNKLRDRRLTRLKVFPLSTHTYNDKIK